jgi:hypothetical protein
MFIAKMYGGPGDHARYIFYNNHLKSIQMNRILKMGIVASIIIIAGCEQLPDPAGVRGVAVIPAITDINPGIFDSKDLEHSYVEFKVTLPEGTNTDKVTIAGSYAGKMESIEVAEVTSFPATVRLSSADVANKLGIDLADISNGDVFTFELITYANGVVTRSNAVIFVAVACAYNPDLAIGSYHSVSSDWNTDGDITLTRDPDDPYKIYVSGLEEMEGLVEDQGPLVMYIDPVTYEVTVPEKTLASEAFGYGSISYSGHGVYHSCDGSYVMYFDISLTELGNQGTNKFDFTRNP